MVSRFADIASLYRNQVATILSDKPEMWCMGFRNALISNHSYSEYTTNNPSRIPYLMPYDIGFQEGMHYSKYKIAAYNEFLNVKPKNDGTEVITGFVIQNYDFSFDGIEATNLAERHNNLIDLIDSSDEENYIGNASILAEEEKICSLIKYLYECKSKEKTQ